MYPPPHMTHGSSVGVRPDMVAHVSSSSYDTWEQCQVSGRYGLNSNGLNSVRRPLLHMVTQVSSSSYHTCLNSHGQTHALAHGGWMRGHGRGGRDACVGRILGDGGDRDIDGDWRGPAGLGRNDRLHLSAAIAFEGARFILYHNRIQICSNAISSVSASVLELRGPTTDRP